MSKVFVLEQPNASLDISKAKDFGELVFVFDRKEYRCSCFKTVEYTEKILNNMETLGYDPDVDFFLVAGSMVPIVTAMVGVVSAFGKVKVLFYRANEMEYVERTLC